MWHTAAAVALEPDNDDELLNGLAGFRLNAGAASAVALGRAGAMRKVEFADDDVLAAASGFRDDDRVVLFVEGNAYAFDRAARGAGGAGNASDGTILSPMPGKIIAVEVEAGMLVEAGDRLVTLEAMKMEHSLVAPFAGKVAELVAKAGAQVSEGTLLVRIEAVEPI